MKQEVLDLIDGCFKRHPVLESCRGSIISAFDMLIRCHTDKNMLLVCGNGGSAADAEHIVGELMNRFHKPRQLPDLARQKLGSDEAGIYLGEKLQQAFRAVSLVSQTALVTAIANDLGPDLVFAQQVYGYGRAGDLLWVLSTSGNSPNIINALRVAKSLDMKTIGFSGESGGAMGPLCDCLIKIPSLATPVIQEYHLVLYHLICSMVETEVF